ncbi:MAG: heavy metal translocating P-type ATPase [Actinomycetota bacterium]
MDVREIDLKLSGMTCSSCVASIEGSLNKMPGVSATVNFATESAHVIAPEGVEIADLLGAVSSVGYKAELLSASNNQFLETPALGWRLVVALIFAIPTIVISMVMSLHSQINEAIYSILDSLNILRPISEPWGWLAIGLSLPVVFIAGWPIHRVGLRSLRHANMDTLISIGTLSAFIWSCYAHATESGSIYVEVAAGVMLFILFGRYLETRSKIRAGAALRALLELGAKEVSIIRNGEEILAPIDHLIVGDLFMVRPGEAIATDGIVVEGESDVDLSLLTGESLPIHMTPGSRVIGATININGRLIVRAERVGAETELARITRMVVQAQGEKAPIARLADRIAAIFVPTIIALALATFLTWLIISGEVAQSIAPAITLLVIACPCALGLATPIAFLVASGRGAQLGIILRTPAVLEQSDKSSGSAILLLDKTGTVTTGKIAILSVETFGIDRSLLLSIAGTIENQSEHPIARGIVSLAKGENCSFGLISEFESHSGRGVAGRVEIAGKNYLGLIGSPEAIAYGTAGYSPEILAKIEEIKARGRSPILISLDGSARALIEIGDQIKSDSPGAIKEFTRLGYESILVTGDSERAAAHIAQVAGIPSYRAHVLPEDKVNIVKEYQSKGHRVVMIGDGVNDAAALAQADVSMAMGTGTDSAIAVADITLIRSSLSAAVDSIRLSRKTLRIIKENLGWAFIYNVIGIPIAATGNLNPMYAGGAMALSSLLVVTNSLRLRNFSAK